MRGTRKENISKPLPPVRVGISRCLLGDAVRYDEIFMEALKIKATVRKHVNVLHHLVGHFKSHLSSVERAELDGVIADYHRGLVPLVVPLTLVKHYVTRYEIAYIHDQVYLNPHPKELMLRNRV